jgi:hypothetical protein
VGERAEKSKNCSELTSVYGTNSGKILVCRIYPRILLALFVELSLKNCVKYRLAVFIFSGSGSPSITS